MHGSLTFKPDSSHNALLLLNTQLRLFEISPELKELWGFQRRDDPNDPAIYQQKAFLQKGAALLLAVDKAVAMLGPDLSPLEEELFALGRRHIHMKAEPDFWPLVGDALMYTLRQGLGENYTDHEEEAWTIIYNFMSYWMVEGLLAEKKERWEAKARKQTAARRDSNQSVSLAVQKRRNSAVSTSTTDSTASWDDDSSVDDASSTVTENIYEPVAGHEITFRTVQLVLDSWQMVRQVPDWQTKAATMVLGRLFELVPQIRTAWGFSADFDPTDLKDKQQKKFLTKGKAFILGVDRAISFLGPDMEPLESELTLLGRVHYLRMAAQPQFWPPVGVALMDTLENVLAGDFGIDMKEAWDIMYHFMAYWMIEGLLKEQEEGKSSNSQVVEC